MTTNKYVEIFPWDDNFNTGIATIDFQHKRLVELLNKLANHLAFKIKSPTLDEVFNELTLYAANHFKDEETIWQQYFDGDDWNQDHQSIHKRFLDDVTKIKSHDQDSYEEVMEEVVGFLTQWVAFHIIEADRRMASAVLAMQQGQDLETAKKLANAELNEAARALIKSILGMYENLSDKTLALIREINERQRLQSKLQLANNALESSMDAIVITDAKLHITEANPAFCHTLGLERTEIFGADLCLLKPSLADTHSQTTIWPTLKENNHWAGEIYERKANGEFEPEWLTISAIKKNDDQISNYVAIFSSISELIERQHKLEKIANHDPLTGLPNRRLLTDRLEQAIAYATRKNNRIAICYLDLDGFKQVNDVYGHAAGDHLLKEIATRLKRIIRNNDTVARLGGDEFVLLFNDLSDLNDVTGLLDRVITNTRQHIELQNGTAQVSASIGVSYFPDHSRDAVELMLYADLAMYQAKNHGKSRYCLYQAS